MKKIISLSMVVLSLLSTMSIAYATTTYNQNNADEAHTNISLSPAPRAVWESYQVTVPSELSPGDTGTISVSGSWNSEQILTVSCPDKVTLNYKDQYLDVHVDFEGISVQGSDTKAITAETEGATKNIHIEDATVMFGNWTGVLDYSVNLISVSSTEEETITFTVDEISHTARAEMTWEEWIASEYNAGEDFDITEDGKVLYGGYELIPVDNAENYQTQFMVLMDGAQYVSVSVDEPVEENT